jgi:hypothetical protein
LRVPSLFVLVKSGKPKFLAIGLKKKPNLAARSSRATPLASTSLQILDHAVERGEFLARNVMFALF